MLIRTSATLVLATLLLYAQAQAAPKPRVVVVFDIQNKGAPLTAQDLESMTDYLGNQLGEGGHLRIVPRSEIRQRLRAGKRASYKDCYDQRCQIEVGRELAAQMTVATRIGKVGSSCILTAALYDLKTAASARTSSATAACNADALLVALAKVAKALRDSRGPTSSSAPTAQAAPVRVIERRIVERQVVEREVERKSVWVAVILSALPGGGMYYVGKPLWGALYTVSTIAGMVMLVTGFADDFNTPLTAVGASLFYGGVIIGAIHAGISASNWRPPGEKRQQASRSAGARLMLPLLRVSF